MILIVCPNPAIDKFIKLPKFSYGEVNRSYDEISYPGGKGVHVALALKELGEDCVLAGFWGGPTGDWIKKECEKRGVNCIGPEIPGWTRTCLTLKTNNEANDTEIVEKGPEVSTNHIDRLINMIKKNIKNADALVVSGSWPPGTIDNVYNLLNSLAKEVSIPFWVDASGKRLIEAIKSKPFGIHINRNEAAALIGPGKHPKEYAEALLSHCTLSAITDGANGLYLAKEEQIVHAYCTVDHVISTIGCGDCLLAGLILSHKKNEHFSTIARSGVACGAANCIRPELGMLFEKDVQYFKKKATCNEILVHDKL